MEEVAEEIKFRLFQYGKVRWNTRQSGFIRKDEQRARIQNSLRCCIQKRFRRSMFGTFLQEFNQQQDLDREKNEEKLSITTWDLNHNNSVVRDELDQNKLFDNELELLKEAVATTNVIDMNFMYKKLDNLRIHNCFFSKMDSTIKQFENLMVLVLSGNKLTQLNGNILPRKLIFLELFDNSLESVESLTNNCPKTMIHLGLGRNKLSNNSKLYLLVQSHNFKLLHSLDLSDNDIYNLTDLLKAIAGLQALTSLQLNGNPCYVRPDYKTCIVKVFPDLKHLDYTELLVKDRNVLQKDDDKNGKAQLFVHCYRIIGLKKPPREKKVNQSIHIEITLPLLEPVHDIETPEESLEYLELNKKTESVKINESPDKPERKSDKKLKKRKTIEKKSKKSSKKPPKPIDEKSIYVSGKVYNPQYKNYNFRTDSKPWSKVIEFDPIFIDCPDENLKLLSDTLKTFVNVRVIYLKTASRHMSKKIKSPKQDKKSKKSNQTKQQSEFMIKETNNSDIETILDRVTLANFYCELTDINWSDKSMDFYWADHPDANPNAIPVEGSLNAIQYIDKKEARAARKAKKASKDGKASSTLEKPIFPNIFTCQIGFGLKRNYFQ